MARRLELTVPPELDGARVGDLLRGQLGLSGSALGRIKRRAGAILLDGQAVRADHIVHAGQTLQIRLANGAETAEGEDAPTVACYAVTISLNRTFPGSGTPLICSLARDDYKLSDDVSIRHMVVKMIEGATTYTLRTVSDSIPE